MLSRTQFWVCQMTTTKTSGQLFDWVEKVAPPSALLKQMIDTAFRPLLSIASSAKGGGEVGQLTTLSERVLSPFSNH